jgi:hypothetical protein
MATKTIKPPSLPEGASFAVPLGDGRFTVCRVLLDAASKRADEWNNQAVMVACSAWIGAAMPAPDDPALRPILRLTHHSWRDQLQVLWISDPVPKHFVPIGHIEPSAAERRIPCMSFGSWDAMPVQALAQWRWTQDRDAVLAEDVTEARRQAEVHDIARREREAYLGRVTLEELLGGSFFPTWKDHVTDSLIEASQAIMRQTVQRLIELGAGATEGQRMDVLRRCIEAFNELDSQTAFIETIEREDICQEFEAVSHACGLGAHDDLADRWREW